MNCHESSGSLRLILHLLTNPINKPDFIFCTRHTLGESLQLRFIRSVIFLEFTFRFGPFVVRCAIVCVYSGGKLVTICGFMDFAMRPQLAVRTDSTILECSRVAQPNKIGYAIQRKTEDAEKIILK